MVIGIVLLFPTHQHCDYPITGCHGYIKSYLLIPLSYTSHQLLCTTWHFGVDQEDLNTRHTDGEDKIHDINSEGKVAPFPGFPMMSAFQSVERLGLVYWCSYLGKEVMWPDWKQIAPPAHNRVKFASLLYV